jgi:hypothetical protein
MSEIKLTTRRRMGAGDVVGDVHPIGTKPLPLTGGEVPRHQSTRESSRPTARPINENTPPGGNQ